MTRPDGQPFRPGPLVAALLCTVMAPQAGAQTTASPAAAVAPAFRPPTFSNNTLTITYGPQFRNPFVATAAQPRGADIARVGVEFKHIDAWRYGHNFVDLVAKKSASVEPAADSRSGAQAIYAILRSGISINRVSGRPVIALGPLRDIDIQAGLNLQEKNTAMAPDERSLYIGPNFQFVLGHGVLSVALQLRKEWNYNGILGKKESFDTDFNIEPVWHFPFHIGRAQFAFDGYAEYNSPKGRDASGQATHGEIFARPQLKLDIGTAVGLSSNVLHLAVGLEYWDNKFGKNADRVPGAEQLTPMVSLGVHWPSQGAAH